MLTEVGRVVAVEEGSLWVETLRQSSCGACAAQSGCGHGLLNRLGSRRRISIRVLAGGAVEPDPDYVPGEQVRFAVPERLILRGSVIVYLLPLCSMLLLAAGMARYPLQLSADLSGVLGAAMGLLLGVALVRTHAWWHRNDPELQPRLLGRVSSNTQADPAGLI
jgi:sigma-E factor negative regulatory protein RseC